MTSIRENVTDAAGVPLPLTKRRRGVTVSWSDAGGAHRFTLRGHAIVGSAPDATLQISDPRVSRLHAELDLDDDGVWVHDLGSRNGTWLDHARIDRVRLETDASLKIAATPVAVQFEGASNVALWPENHLGKLIGQSAAMRELFMQLSEYAHSDANVLVQGETGTGKELVAQTLHGLSDRAKGPLVVVDCGVLPDALFESELFGHTKGAFTGAVAAREGAIEAANGGTVFLDEVGELPLHLQPKLLRVLESHTVRRLGQHDYATVDVRFIAATHRNLELMVSRGQFREDLYFRLAVLPVRVPALRERPDDLAMLLGHFLRGAASNELSEVLPALEALPWTGNVRELRTFAERATALGVKRAVALLKGGMPATALPVPATAPRAGPGEFPPVNTSIPFKELRESWVDHLEREYVGKLLQQHARNVAGAAAAAGLDPSYIHRLVRKHGL